MKKILMYIDKSEAVADDYYMALVQAFESFGQEVLVVDVSKPDYLQHLMSILQTQKIYFSMGHNDLGINLKFNTGEFLYEKLPMIHFSWLGDAPYNEVMKNMNNIGCRNLIVGCADRSHILAWQIVHKDAAQIVTFMPSMGTAIPNPMGLDQKRDIDVLFSATFYGMPKRVWRDMSLSWGISKLLDEVADYLEEHSVSVFRGFKEVLLAQELYDDGVLASCYKFFTMMYVYIKTYRRVKLLECVSAAGILVDVCDESWLAAPFSSRLRILGTRYRESQQLYLRTKILLQDMAEFNEGTHQRIFDAMLSGAAIVSEKSSYIEDSFLSGEDIILFDGNKGLRQVPIEIENILADNGKREDMIHKAYHKVLAHYMPKNSAEKILKLVDLYSLRVL